MSVVSPLPSSLLHIAARKVEPDFVVRCMSHEVLWKAMVMALMTVVNSLITRHKKGIRAEGEVVELLIRLNVATLTLFGLLGLL